VALLVAVVSGVLMLIWYSPSLQFAIRHWRDSGADAGRLGAGDAPLQLGPRDAAARLSCGPHFLCRKFSGARWLSWVSGVAMLAMIWFIGWTGYWLVWDNRRNRWP